MSVSKKRAWTFGGLLGVLLVGILYGYSAWSASVNLTVIVDPAGGSIPCDIGPNYVGSIPRQAAAAGYTHCAANLDFTNAQFSNPNTWLRGCGASSPIMKFITNFGAGNPAPCSDATMVDDTANGGAAQVLQLTYTHADWLNSVDAAWLFVEAAPIGPHINQGWFVDMNFRVSPATLTSCPSGSSCIFADLWSYPLGVNCPGCSIQEFDFMEVFGSTSGGSYSSAGNGGGVGIGTGGVFTAAEYDPSVYAQISVLETIASSGSPNLAACWYINGAFVYQGDPPLPGNTCGSATFLASDLTEQSQIYPAQIGPQTIISIDDRCGGAGVHTCQPTSTQTMFVQRFTIWACPGYQSGPCYGTVLTTPP
jgi:hypothetical protein